MYTYNERRMTMKPRMRTCCICKKKFYGYGNNPRPVKLTGRCCDECNITVLIHRIKLSEKGGPRCQ